MEFVESEQSLLQEEARQDTFPSKHTWQQQNIPLLVSVIFNTVLALSLLWSLTTSTSVIPTTSTDFRSIPTQPRRLKPTVFDDKLLYDSTTHQFWRDLDPSLPQYFGRPSPELDKAWANLLQGEIIGISDEEARSNPDLDFEENDRHKASGHFFIAIDVMHSLHWLNAARKELDKEYYSSAVRSTRATGSHHHGLFSGEAQRIHIDHCLNHIRQSLQCHPGLSAAAMKRQQLPGGESFYLGNAQKHTCQDWNAVREWIDERRASISGAWDE